MSIALYAAACVLPAIRMERVDGWFAAKEATVVGWQCLMMGPPMFFLVFPLLLWVANFGLLWLWLRALAGMPLPPGQAWSTTVLAVVNLLPIAIMPVTPLPGAFVWLAAIVLRGYAASFGSGSRA